MYVTVFQLCDVRPELFQYMRLFITGINMYEYSQQLRNINFGLISVLRPFDTF